MSPKHHRKQHRVVHLLTSLNPGGVTTLMRMVIPGLSKLAYDNIIVTTLNKGELPPNHPLGQYPLFYCPKWIPFYPSRFYRAGRLIRHSGKLTFVFRLWWLFLKLRPHVVHSHMHGDSWISQMLATHWAGAKFVLTIHSPSTTYPHTWRGKKLFARLTRPSDRIVTDSPSIVDVYRNFLKTTSLPERHFNIPITPGVEDPGLVDVAVKSQVKEKFQIPPNQLVIGSIGRIVSEKRYGDLVLAFQRVLKKFPDLHLLLIGDGDARQSLDELVEKLNLSGHICMPGFLENPQYWLNGIDIFVIPSMFEGFGIATVEAMAKQLAVVGSDVSYTNQILNHEKNGLLFQPKDVGGLANGLSCLISDKALRERLAKQARADYEKYHLPEICIDSHDNVYQDLV